MSKHLYSKPVLKRSVKSNLTLWLGITLLICFYVFVIFIAFSAMSEEETGAMGMDMGILQLLGLGIYKGNGMFFVIIYCAVVANKLVVNEVDNGSMAYTLNTPVTRKQVIFSKVGFYAASIFAMVLAMFIVGLLGSLFLPESFDVGKLALLNLGMFLFSFMLGGLCCLASCWFNRSGHSLAVGLGVPMVSFIFSSLSMVQEIEFFKYLSLNTLFAVDNIILGENYIIQFIAMLVIGSALYAVGINKFLKKDLPL